MGDFAPLLTTTNWNEEWKHLQKARKPADSAEYWDERSKNFGCKDKSSPYIAGFIEHMNIKPEDSVFDMGCGNGGLALPLAEMGHNVIAADFSQGMLSRLKEDACAKKVEDLISTIQMSWSDDWEQYGVHQNVVDIAIASRSIATDDLEDSLMKLDSVARKRCCITLSTSVSPRIDELILVDLGIQAQCGRDFLYAFNILVSNNRKPEVYYLENSRHDHYESLEQAHESLKRMHDSIKALVPNETKGDFERRFWEWCDANLVKDYDIDGSVFWRLRKPRQTKWAFIAWTPF